MASQRQRLQHARKAKGLNQRELAARIGVPQSTLARLELEQHQPSLRVALLLAAELGRTVEELFGTAEIAERRARAAGTAGPATTPGGTPDAAVAQ